MEYIIGGLIKNPDSFIQSSINYFERRFLRSFEFLGIVENNYFLGIIKEKINKNGKNIFFIDGSKVFKSLYYHEVPEEIMNDKDDSNTINQILNLKNDFIYAKYEKNKGIKVFIDKFAHEKVYYSIKEPYLFSTSFKFLISMLKPRKVNYTVISQFLATGLNMSNETIFSSIKRLHLGEYLLIHNNQLKINLSWKMNKAFFEIPEHDEKDLNFWTNYLYDSLKEVLNFPCKDTVLSMMSGGLDSTVITSIFKKEFNIPIKAMTIKVPNYNEEEVQKAIEIAEYIDIPHVVKEIRVDDKKKLDKNFSEIFNIFEEPMGGSAYFSRFLSYNEASKTPYKNVMLGEGAGELMSYLRHDVLSNYRYAKYLYYIPMLYRSSFMKIIHNFYEPSFKITKYLRNKKHINLIDVTLNSNFLESNSQLDVFQTSVQFCNLLDTYKITNHKIDLETFIAPIVRFCKLYPFKDYNKYSFQLLMNSINGDPFVAHNILSYYDLKLYTPYNSDISIKKILPIPQRLKMMGDRYKWLVREMAKKKELLPKNYFDWKPKYGLRQEFFREQSFNIIKNKSVELVNTLDKISFINLKPFYNFFKKLSLARIKHHSSEYMKFNIWFGFLSWLSSIEF